jgi:AcrR family transcriptional regulator
MSPSVAFMTRSRGASDPVPQRLLAAASRLFAQQGFRGTSVQEIVEAAHVTKGALYHYYGSKDDLLYDIYHRVLALQTERLEAIAGEDASATDRLRRAYVDVFDTTAANANDMVIFFREMHHLSAAKQRKVRDERRRYHETFRSLVEQGQRTGQFRDNIAADLVVHSFFGAVHHLTTWFRPNGPMSAHDVGETFAELLLSSLAPTDRRAPLRASARVAPPGAEEPRPRGTRGG